VTTFLLDANVAIALAIAEHEHHDRASDWLARTAAFAVCPVVEGALVRFVLRLGESGATARALTQGLRNHPRGVFWPDDVSYADVQLEDLRGHRQVTDVYLAGLAATHGGRVATLDSGLARLRPDAVELI
jgi:toxin-antitoxin system PIN domain toxin